ncbi:MAG: hypothetical protein HW414_1409 [Dehalococcoidia bacterium]|nr:hypothetical protein [Dehalococcoidia bacterium]
MRLPGITMGLLLPLILASSLAFAACTPEQQQMLEGILKNVDSINGTITVVDKSGQTHVITIRSNSTVQTQSGASSLEALESGTNVKIRLESRNVAGKIEADLARVSGTISAVNPTAQDITVTPEKGGPPVTVHVTSGTSIRLNSDRTGNFSDLGPQSDAGGKRKCRN